MTHAEFLAYESRRASIRDGAGRNGGEGVSHESDLHEQIMDECSRRGWIPIHSRMDRPSTNGVGTPDFIIPVRDGKTLYVEAKAKGGKLTREQTIMGAYLAKHGHTLHVVRSLAEFIAVL